MIVFYHFGNQCQLQDLRIWNLVALKLGPETSSETSSPSNFSSPSTASCPEIFEMTCSSDDLSMIQTLRSKSINYLAVMHHSLHSPLFHLIFLILETTYEGLFFLVLKIAIRIENLGIPFHLYKAKICFFTASVWYLALIDRITP